ncbi:hypothetical protein LNV08_09190 [Paucibacter sp. TC2R-5]|uniref:hypothetical protein n=1 Tax=Paucibacter sp. TC2R-5 TaxID=2893555 RepID=UPI0021E3E067|nr:hypothetical protein [Paucibacter sp. TC2R-5]MCV2359150.1 hypothetical protein [Paucibacter sp. TC2R-5]
MNFKALAVAATLALTVGASFAADIDLNGSTLVTAAPGDSSVLLGLAEAALLVGDTHANNNAVIYQDDSVGAAALEQLAYIDQVGTLGGLAMIVQLGNATVANVAYVQQVGTTNARAVITQR